MEKSDWSGRMTVSATIGELTFTFPTDIHGSNVKAMLTAVRRIASKYGIAETEIKQTTKPVGSVPRSKAKKNVGKGTGETSLIKGELVRKLIPEGFFKKGRQTGEVKSEVEKVLGVKLLSRKVSQALGELRDAGVLSRVGGKGNFSYIQISE
jgi:hypothetical protein